jgi:hypothetical protein
MATLRHFNISDDDKWNELLKTVFSADTNPMIRIREWAETEYYNKVQDKLDALSLQYIEDQYLFVWEGKKKTDVFELREEDITRILNLY